MKLLIEIDYLPNVIGVDPLTHLKSSIEKCCDGAKVISIFKSAKDLHNPILKNDGTKEGETMILEDKSKTKKVSKVMLPKNKKERIISDHGKWKSYDDPTLVPDIEM